MDTQTREPITVKPPLGSMHDPPPESPLLK